MPEYRQQRTHNEFLVPLNNYFSSIDEINGLLSKSLESHFDVNYLTGDELDQEMEKALDGEAISNLSRSKYENYD